MDLSQDIHDFKSPLQELKHPLLREKNISVFVKREDLLPFFSSGNKFRKLYFNLREAEKLQKKTWVTFGGAFSNHILATAEAGYYFKVPTVGIIRGEELGNHFNKTLETNPTLKRVHELGMKLHFVSRSTYRSKENNPEIEDIIASYHKPYLIPEGGTNELAVKGCESILNEEDSVFDCILCPVGTGGTISGIINASMKHQKVIGFSALKGDFLKDEVLRYTSKTNWNINTDFHFGGYAKYNSELIDFINELNDVSGLPTEPIYSGKMLYGLFEMIKKDYFSKKNKILLIHTGGLQSISSINQKLSDKGLKKINV